MSSSAVSSSSSSFSVISGSSASGSGSTHRPGMSQAESYELHSGPTMCVMNDSWSLANCGADRSMKGLMGRPRLDSSSPYINHATYERDIMIQMNTNILHFSQFNAHILEESSCLAISTSDTIDCIICQVQFINMHANTISGRLV